MIEDLRPSQLLSRMRTLPFDVVGEALLKFLCFLCRPNTTRSIVGVLSDVLPQLVSVAEKSHYLAMFSQINVVISTAPTHISSLESQIAQLTQQVYELTANFNQWGRSRKHNFRKRNNRCRHSRKY